MGGEVTCLFIGRILQIGSDIYARGHVDANSES